MLSPVNVVSFVVVGIALLVFATMVARMALQVGGKAVVYYQGAALLMIADFFYLRLCAILIGTVACVILAILMFLSVMWVIGSVSIAREDETVR